MWEAIRVGVLQQEPARTREQGSKEILVTSDAAEHHDGRVGSLASDLRSSLDPAAAGHVDIQERDIGPHPDRRQDGVRTVPHLRDDRHPRVIERDTYADERRLVVVRKEDREGHCANLGDARRQYCSG
jgi:hypothetical protein